MEWDHGGQQMVGGSSVQGRVLEVGNEEKWAID